MPKESICRTCIWARKPWSKELLKDKYIGCFKHIDLLKENPSDNQNTAALRIVNSGEFDEAATAGFPSQGSTRKSPTTLTTASFSQKDAPSAPITKPKTENLCRKKRPSNSNKGRKEPVILYMFHVWSKDQRDLPFCWVVTDTDYKLLKYVIVTRWGEHINKRINAAKEANSYITE